jgi:hypothetical protein
MRLQEVSTSYEDVLDLALIRKVRKGWKKGFGKGQKKKEDSISSNHKKKDLIHIKYFNYNKHCHYSSQCLEKKGKGMQQQKLQFVGSVNGPCVDELTVILNKTFCMSLFLSKNTISSFLWYVDSGSSRHITYDIKIFTMFQ